MTLVLEPERRDALEPPLDAAKLDATVVVEAERRESGKSGLCSSSGYLGPIEPAIELEVATRRCIEDCSLKRANFGQGMPVTATGEN